jgi:hypothetical protein
MFRVGIENEYVGLVFRRLVAVCNEHQTQKKKGRIFMLYTIAVVLLILWLLGLVSSYTMGGFIHVLLVLAVVVILLRVISGRRIA